MDDATRLAAIRYHFEHVGDDLDVSHEIYHEDAVLEFPQSKERFVGKANFLPWRKQYPSTVTFEINRIRGSDDLWILENSIRYDDGPWNYGCAILEFRGDKISRETIYFMEPWEAPEWRAPWRAEWQDESLGLAHISNFSHED
jgi:hypothetical protein